MNRRDADTVYARAELEFHAECKAKLERLTEPHKWWRALRESVFGTSPSVPPLTMLTGSLLYDSAENAELLSYYFDGMQSRSGAEFPQPLLTF